MQTDRIREALKTHWRPRPVNPPAPDPTLKEMTGAQRSAEVIRYSILSIEWWISPGGKVREWLRQNTLLAVVLAIPVFLVLPVVTFGLWQLVSWLMALTSIAGKLIVLPVLTLVATAAVLTAVYVLKVIFRN